MESKYKRRKEIWDQISGNLFDNYVKKNMDYGDSFNDGINIIGPLHFVSRVYDKVTRLITLSKQPAKVTSESFNDSVCDMITYGMMYLLNEKEKGK